MRATVVLSEFLTTHLRNELAETSPTESTGVSAENNEKDLLPASVRTQLLSSC